LPDNAILIARAMGPGALLDYDRKRLRGLVLEEGTANSHVSIVARALGIPAVGEVPNAPGIADPRRRHHRRRHLGLDLYPPLGRDRIGLCRAGAVSRRRQAQYARCATSPASPRTASRSN
jgi:phosphotransferase system enzyme I (PtsP)